MGEKSGLVPPARQVPHGGAQPAPVPRPQPSAPKPSAPKPARGPLQAAPEPARRPQPGGPAPESIRQPGPAGRPVAPEPAGQPGHGDPELAAPAGPAMQGPGVARPGTGRARNEPAAAPRAEPPPPSWAKVLGTTLRLWLQRRSARARRLAIVAVVAVVLAAVALTVLLGRHPGAAPTAARKAAQGSRGQSAAVSAAALAAAAAARGQAAAWVAAQVSRSAVVACDPVMCAALQAAGVPAASLLPLQPQAPDPLGSAVVAATAIVRSQIGPRLASVYAPAVLATFGTATARVDIRVTAPDGATAYLSLLSADVQARQAYGAELLRNPQLGIAAAARQQLAAGDVDARLLITLATLASLRAVRVVAFSDGGPGGSPGMPLRAVELASPQRARDGGRSYLQSVLAFAGAQRAPFLATTAYLYRWAGGHFNARIEFAAPTPLGLLATASRGPIANGR
jgi:hypothetical protein